MKTACTLTSVNPLVAEHLVYGQRVLPGLAYLDMLCQAFVEHGVPLARLCLRDLALYHPARVGDGEVLSLTIEVTPSQQQAQQRVTVNGRVSVDGQEGPALQYASAEMETATAAVHFDERLDWAGIQAGTLKTIDMADIYARCRERELVHGDFMRAQGTVHVTQDAVYLSCRVGVQAETVAGMLLFHPVLMDACAVGLCWAVDGSEASQAPQRLMLPLHFGAFQASAPLQRFTLARLKLASIQRSEEIVRLTLDFFDEAGRKVAEITDFTAKLVRDAGLIDARRVAPAASSLGSSSRVAEERPADCVGATGPMAAMLQEMLSTRVGRRLTPDDMETGYYELGLTSASLLEFVHELERALGCSLSPTLLFEHTTIAALSKHLDQQHGSASVDGHVPEAKGASPHAVEREPVAIIGMAGRFPQARDLNAFWQNLVAGRDCITEVPASRWDWHGFAHLKTSAGRDMVSRWGGFVDGVDEFDPQFFRISPREAEVMDPQERLFLENCWEAIEDAGYTPHNLSAPRGPYQRRHVGVYAGVMHKDYVLLGASAQAHGHAVPLSMSNAPIANRVSYVMGFHGPSMAIDTVCSSSLVAVHLALQSLWVGESDVALAGGVNLSLHPGKYISYGQLGMHASDGRCRAFGEGGDGYVSADGVGVVVLKPLSRAVADGDHVYAVIKGSVTNHVGTVSGFTVPHPVAQADMVLSCLEQAQVHPRSISYVEAHGTGTSLGDPIEMEGLRKAFSHGTQDTGFCAIGSVKSNIGHAESAAGISGLIKVALQLRHRTLVPSLHAAPANPHIDWAQSPFTVVRGVQAWEGERQMDAAGSWHKAPLRACISSFGATGSNAHLVLEESPQAAELPSREGTMPSANAPAVVLLSARTPAQLAAQVSRLDHWVRTHDVALPDLAFTLQVGRVLGRYRLAMLVSSMEELKARLQRMAEGGPDEEMVWRGDARDGLRSDVNHGLEDEADPSRLADAWVHGAEVPWQAWHRGHGRRRVSLPTYPFARERYGLPHGDVPSNWSVAKLAGGAKPGGLGLDLDAVRSRLRTFDAQMAKLLWRTLCGLGVFDVLPCAWPGDLQGHALLSKYARWLQESIRTLMRHQYLTEQEGQLVALRSTRVDMEAASREWQLYVEEVAGDHYLSAQVRLADVTLRALPQILLGQSSATEIMFPDMTLGLVEPVYKHNPVADHFNASLADTLVAHVQQELTRRPGVKLRLLEVGAGTGGTSTLLFERLRPLAEHIEEYCYTDLSKAFLLHGQAHYQAVAPYLVTRVLDIETPPAQQGMVGESYDVVIAANVLHATRDITRTIQHVRSLMRTGALLLLNEIASENLFTHLTFALLDGWWLFEDEALRIPGSPGLSPQGWRTLLSAQGFGEVRYPTEDVQSIGQQVIAAISVPVQMPARLSDEAVVAASQTSVAAKRDRALRDDADAVHVWLRELLVSLAGQLLKLPATELDPEVELGEFGFDSITLSAYARLLNERFGLALNATVFFEAPTLEALTLWLLREHGDVLQQHVTRASSQSLADASDQRPMPAATLPFATADADGHPGDSRQTGEGEPMAIVGMSGEFPMAEDTQELWSRLLEGQDCIGRIPDERWSQEHGEAVRHAGVIDVAAFDAGLFGVSPRDAMDMDPQQRLAMTHTWKVIEDAGYAARELAGSRTGVFIATASSGYNELLKDAGRPVGGNSALGVMGSMGPNRISYWFNFQGPSESVDTACSSSLVAVHRAIMAIRDGECDQAVVGGVNTIVSPQAHASFGKAGMLSPDGRCRTFSEHANGYVRGEGVGMFLLKPLSAAERDGNHIYAVIVASATGHGGRAQSLTAPNPLAQAKVIQSALRRARLPASRVGYIEAHGTGTSLGDPIEFRGLTAAFGKRDGEAEPTPASCGLGSIKSNIGHLELAAGAAGLIKVVLQLQHRTLVRTLHCDVVNPYMALPNSPFYIVQNQQAWQARQDAQGRDLPRVAGVSSFGAGGTNAHVIVQEYVSPPARAAGGGLPALVLLSARDASQLAALKGNMLRAIQVGRWQEHDLPDMAYTLQVGREAWSHRWAAWVDGLDGLSRALASAADDVAEGPGPEPGKVWSGEVRKGQEVDAAGLISTWSAQEDWPKLGESWVKGATVDWHTLHTSGPRRKRLSLPGLPMARSPFWPKRSSSALVRGQVVAGQSEQCDVAPSSLGKPWLVHDTSGGASRHLSCVFTKQDFFFLDHRVRGQHVMPAAAQLELARDAWARVCGDEVASIVLTRVVFARPVVLAGATLEVHVRFNHVTERDAVFDIYTEESRGDGTANVCLHSQGAVACEPGLGKPTLDLSSLLASCRERTFTAQACYALFESAGMGFGPSMRALQAVHVGRSDGWRLALGDLSLPDCLSHEESLAVLHPSLLDAALQACVGALVDNVSADGRSTPPPLAMPFAVDRLEVHAPITRSAWALVREEAFGGTLGTPTDAVRQLSVDILDGQGGVCVTLQGLRCRMLDAARPAALVDAGTGQWVPVWRESALARAGGPRIEWVAHHVLVCEWGVTNGQSDVLARCLQPQQGGANWTIAVMPRDADSVDMAKLYRRHAETLLSHLQALSRDAHEGRVLLQLVVPSDGPGALMHGLTAMLKSAKMEWPRLSVQVLGVPMACAAARAATWLDELAAQGSGEFRLADEAGHVLSRLQWERTTLPGQPPSTLWRDQGVYLLSGGAGGLGHWVAQRIAERSHAPRIVLLGRRVADERVQAQLDVLSALGAQATYDAIDVSDARAVGALVDRIVQTHGGIDGVLHCAGTLRDGLMHTKSMDDLGEVLVPKVAGAQALDAATAHLPLSFFILFSSIASAMGNAGQTDYAAANGFLDAFAHWRQKQVDIGLRRGRTLSVNWPLWADGGMRLNDAQQSRLLRVTGLVPMSAAQGLDLLESVLAGPYSQIMLMHGEVHRLVALADAASLLGEEPAEVRAMPGTRQVDSVRLLEKVEQGLLAEAAALLEIDEADIDMETPVNEFGFDSISLTSFANALNERYNLALSPTVFFDTPTLSGLARAVVDRHRDVLAPLWPELIQAEAGASQALPAVAQSVGAAQADAGFVPDGDEAAQHRVVGSSVSDGMNIAIVGMAGRYPKSPDLATFWQNLCDGRDCIEEVPAERWNMDAYYAPEKAMEGKSHCKWGGFIDGVGLFDARFFGMSPDEAMVVDPQCRLFLETVWHLLEDAGLTPESLNSQTQHCVGVYVGAMFNQYRGREGDPVHEPVVSLTSNSSIANRVSQFFGFEGPSMAIDTMCSSSAMAVYSACLALQAGECEAAVAGGINLSIHPSKYVGLSQLSLVGSHEGCRSFAHGDGYLPGEGVGAVLLKPLARALADGDEVLAVIKGCATAHGGRSGGYSVPSLPAQVNVMSACLKHAGTPASTIGYVEAAANGSSLGDAIELAALTRVFGQAGQEDSRRVMLGSVKSNIGHAEAVSGLSQLSKVVLQLRHGALVPTIGAQPENPELHLDQGPFVLSRSHGPWPASGVDSSGLAPPRRALVNSFGAGGSYVSFVLEEYLLPAESSLRAAPQKPASLSQLVVVSARDPAQLRAHLQQLWLNLHQQEAFSLEDLAYTLQTGREAMACRWAWVGADARQLLAAMATSLGEDQSGTGNSRPLADAPAVQIGDAVQARSPLGRMLMGRLSHTILAALMQDRDLTRLATYWVNGGTVPWAMLYNTRHNRRLKLPGYPFAREHHWIPVEPVLPAPVAPRTHVASVVSPRETVGVASIVAAVLGLSEAEVGPLVPLRELGMDSVRAMRLARLLRDALGVEVGARDLLPIDTLADLEELVRDQRTSSAEAREAAGSKEAMLLIEGGSAYAVAVHDVMDQFKSGSLSADQVVAMMRGAL